MAAQKKKQLVEPKVAITLLQTIKDDAIVLGNGEIEVHTFIDPLCVMSQRYLALLYKKNNKVLSKYTIYLHFHQIKSKKSKKHILNILSAESREKVMDTIMLKKDSFTLKNIRNRKNEELFEKVSDVAKKIGVNKRPYIMINGRVK